MTSLPWLVLRYLAFHTDCDCRNRSDPVDVRLVRFGYVASAALWPNFGNLAVLDLYNDQPELVEGFFGRTYDEIMKSTATYQEFLLDLGEEALQLMDDVAPNGSWLSLEEGPRGWLRIPYLSSKSTRCIVLLTAPVFCQPRVDGFDLMSKHQYLVTRFKSLSI